jgi:mono/diheme cytochrome c family protein
MHSFKLGQRDDPALDLFPGGVVETTLLFDRPGKYTFYCTRWCGPNHWRMRGVIEVLPKQGESIPAAQPAAPPFYASLGLNIDAPHPAKVTPERTPSAAQGSELAANLPPSYLSQTFYRTHSPVQAWELLRTDNLMQGLDDQQVWDLVTFIWFQNSGPQALEMGRQLYAQNCAACHGENGAGDGVFAAQLASGEAGDQSKLGLDGHHLKAPADFRRSSSLLGASPALLQGKIIRGGMGTGMPYWGPVLTEDQTWALVDALYAFQFNLEVDK